MKKIDLGLNFDEIRKRIEIDKSQYKSGEWAKKIGLSKQNISNIHGEKGKNDPSLQYIIAVARTTGKSIEWYLYGEDEPTKKETPAQPPNRRSYDKNAEMANAVKYIMETFSSDDMEKKVFLKAFIDAVSMKDRVNELEKKVKKMEDQQLERKSRLAE